MYSHLMQVSKVYLKVEYKSQYYHLIFIKVLNHEQYSMEPRMR